MSIFNINIPIEIEASYSQNKGSIISSERKLFQELITNNILDYESNEELPVKYMSRYTKLRTAILPNVTEISSSAFSGCQTLTKIEAN